MSRRLHEKRRETWRNERERKPLGRPFPHLPRDPNAPKMSAQEALELAKKDGRSSPKIISVLENRARIEREAAATLPGNKPDNGTADDRPKRKVIIVMPGQGDAPGVAEPAPRYYAPRYQAQPQPQVQPQRVIAKDDPTCVQGTWAMLGDEKKYVCLSWHFRGQLYTTDQLEQVLEALGRTRPAYNGN